MRAGIVTLLAWGLCSTTLARADVHIGGGWADHFEGERTEVASLSWVGAQRHPWEWMAGYIGERKDAGVPDAMFLALSKRLTWRRGFVSGGVAWASEDNDVLSGHGQFMTAVGYDFGRVTLSLRHLSNGDTNGRNRGETFLLLDVAF